LEHQILSSSESDSDLETSNSNYTSTDTEDELPPKHVINLKKNLNNYEDDFEDFCNLDSHHNQIQYLSTKTVSLLKLILSVCNHIYKGQIKIHTKDCSLFQHHKDVLDDNLGHLNMRRVNLQTARKKLKNISFADDGKLLKQMLVYRHNI
jgi:hypothetical protein